MRDDRDNRQVGRLARAKRGCLRAAPLRPGSKTAAILKLERLLLPFPEAAQPIVVARVITIQDYVAAPVSVSSPDGCSSAGLGSVSARSARCGCFNNQRSRILH